MLGSCSLIFYPKQIHHHTGSKCITYVPNNTAFIVRPGSRVKSPVTMSARMYSNFIIVL